MTGETEALRRELIAARGAGETEADLQAKYAPGSFGCHEALDRAALLERAISGELLEHGAILANPDWFKLAERATSALGELYQAIGADHLGTNEGG